MSETAVANTSQQLGLIGFDDAIKKVFGGKDIKDKNGNIVGTSFGVRSKKEIAKELNLVGKDNAEKLQVAMLEQSDSAFRVVKGQMASLGGDWTLSRVASRTLSNGVRQISVVVKEVKRNQGPSDEAIAKSLGCSVEEVVAMRTRQQEALKKQEAATVDVDPAKPATNAEQPHDEQQAQG